MSVSAADKVTVRRFAEAAFVAALLSTFLSTLGAAQGVSGAMPPNCEENLDKCSLKIWSHDSFPHRGSEQSTTFSNGETLTCTSNGANTPRSCTLTGGTADNSGSAGSNTGGADVSPTPNNSGSGQQPGNQAQSLARQCADAEQHIRDMTEARDKLQPAVDAERNYYDQAMAMTREMLVQEIRRLQSLPQSSANMRESNFLGSLFAIKDRSAQANTPAAQQANAAQMQNLQAAADQAVAQQQASANYARAEYDQMIATLGERMANIHCDNAPAANP